MRLAWKNFQNAELGDARRTRRLIAVAVMMVTRPEASLPKQMVDWSNIKAVYRLFDCEAVTFEAVAQPHYQKCLNCGSQRCWIVSDTNEINLTKHRDSPGLVFLEKGQGDGFLLHSALMLSKTGQVSIEMCQMPEPRLLSPELKREKPEPIFRQIVSIEELDLSDPKATVNGVLYTSRPATNLQPA